MVWCLTMGALCCSGLALASLKCNPHQILRLLLSPRRLLRGCLTITFLLATTIFLVLAYSLLT